MEIKKLLEFQLQEFKKQNEVINAKIKSGGKEHSVFDLANSYFSELTKETTEARLLEDFTSPFEYKRQEDESWFSIFGKSIQDIIYNINDFEEDYPKFAQAVLTLLLTEPKYQKFAKDLSLYRFKMLSNAIPFLFGNFTIDKEAILIDTQSANSLRSINAVYNNVIKLSDDNATKLRGYFDGIFSITTRSLYVKNNGLEVFIPIPNSSMLGEVNGGSASISLSGYSHRLNPVSLNDDDADVLSADKSVDELYPKFNTYAEKKFENAKYKIVGFNKTMLFSQDAQLFKVMNLCAFDSVLGETETIDSDLVLCFDSMQSQIIVVDVAEFCILYSYINTYSGSDNINIFVDDKGEYLYICGDADISSEIVSKIDVAGKIYTSKDTAVRKTFGRIKIKESNFSKVAYYLWLYKYDTRLSIQEILASVTEEDLSSIIIPNDFLNQQHILTEQQKSISEKVEKDLADSEKTGAEFLELMEEKASKYIQTYAYYDDEQNAFMPKPDNTGMLLSDGSKYLNYIYKVNEIFWMNNRNISPRELIAYFIAKGDKFNYRLLSIRILGFDSYAHKSKVIEALLLENLLCIEDFSLNGLIKEIVKPMQLAYKYEYVTGNYYEKGRKLRIGLTSEEIEEIKEEALDLYQSVIYYFGAIVGNQIIQAQSAWLQANKPIEMVVSGTEKDGNLLMPTMYDEKILNDEKSSSVCDTFHREKSDAISSSDLYDITLTPTDVKSFYFKRMRAKEYITAHFNINVFYEISVSEEEGQEGAGRKYTIVSKKNGAVIYTGKGNDAQSEADCIAYAKANMLYESNGRIRFGWNEVRKYRKDKDETSFTVSGLQNPLKPERFSDKSLSGADWVNMGFATRGEDNGYTRALQAYIPFNEEMIQLLKKCEFISDETWANNKGKKTIINFEPLGFDTVAECVDYAEKNLFLLSDTESKDIYNNILIEYNQLYSKSIREGDAQFSKYLRAKQEDATNYEYVWNKIYNSEMHPFYLKDVKTYDDEKGICEPKKERMYDNSKFPIFLEYSRFFGREEDREFSLAESQIDGVKFYVSSKNAGLFAHEVGFGKTISSICAIYHSMITGEAKRPFVCVPVPVYKNFEKEIHGEEGIFRGLIPHVKIAPISNGRTSVLLKYNKQTLEKESGLKNYSENQIRIIDNFRKLKNAKGNIVNAKYNDQISLESDVDNSFSNFIKDFEQYLDKNIEGWREEESIREVTIARFRTYYDSLLSDKADELSSERDKLSVQIQQAENILSSVSNSRPTYYKKTIGAQKARKWKKIQDAEVKKKEARTGIYAGLGYTAAQDLLEKELDSLFDDYVKILNDEYKKKSEKADKEYSKRLASFVKKILQAVSVKVYDALGYYSSEFLADNTIVMSSHSAISQFEIPLEDAKEAVDNVGISNQSYNSFILELSIRPLSFNKLNTDMIVVDEIHNYNEYYYKAEKLVVTYSPFASVTRKYGKALSNSKEDIGVVAFNTTMSGGTKPSKIVLFKLLENNYKKNFAEKGVYNNLILSATPFVDSLYQMISVFSMVKPCMRVIDFYNNFCYEEYGFNQDSTGNITYTPSISAFKNKIARNQFIKNYTQFYTADKEIDKKRPRKYIFPFIEYEQGVDMIHSYGESSSVVPLSDVQYDLITKIAKFLEGESEYEDIALLKDPNPIKKTNISSFIEELEFLVAELDSAVDEESVKSNLTFIEIFALENYDKKDEGYELIEPLKETIVSNCKKFNIPNPFSKRKSVSEEGDEDLDEEEATIKLSGNLVDRNSRLQYSAKKQQRLCLSPYMLGYGREDKEAGKKSGWAENAALPPLFGTSGENLLKSAYAFVENSPKILFAVKSCISTIENHKNKGENVSGQIIYINDQKFTYGGQGYDSFELIKAYLKNAYSLNQTFSVEEMDDEKEQKVLISVDEIEFIRGTISPMKKKAVESGFNKGLIKILLGSASIKEGINLQGMVSKGTATQDPIRHGTSTIYILTPDYQPMPFMQLEGRAWRQGNPLDNVRIVYILHKNSIDQHIYSRVKTKIMQVKSLLEAGVYEANTTQFQQDIEGVSEYLITDIEKKVNLKWQEKKKVIVKEATEIESLLGRATVLEDVYSDVLNYSKTTIPFLNTVSEFANMNSVVKLMDRAINYKQWRSKHPLVIEFFEKWTEIKEWAREQHSERVDAVVKKDWDEIVDAWSAREKAFKNEIKNQIKVLKDTKKKDVPAPKIDTEIERLELLKFEEAKPIKDSLEYNEIHQRYRHILLEIEKTKHEKMSALMDEYGKLISDASEDYNVRKELETIKIPMLSEGSTSDKYSTVINLLNAHYSPFRNSFGGVLFEDYNFFGKPSEYGVSADGKIVIVSSGQVVNDAVMEYSFLFDCMQKNYKITNYKSERGAYLDEYVYNIAYHKDYAFKKISQTKEYDFGRTENGRNAYFSGTTVSAIVKNMVLMLSAGGYCYNQMGSFESLIGSKVGSQSDMSNLIIKLRGKKQIKQDELLSEALFKSKIRTKYVKYAEKEKKERESLSSLNEFVQFEVDKFSLTNDMIYFRDADGEYLEIRKQIQKA